MMKKALLTGLLASAGSTAALAASTVALYEFNGNLNPVNGVGNPAASAMAAVDPGAVSGFVADTVNGVNRTVYRFDGSSSPATAQGGLQFLNADLMNPNGYSIEAYFSFDEVSGWRRIIDTKDRSEDTGFYVLSGGLQLYPAGTGQGAFAANTFEHVILTFDGSTAVAYLNGASQSVQATNYYSLPASNVISLFLDNTAGPAQTEYSPGKIAWARFYDGALSDSEALDAYNAAVNFDIPPAVPEPGSWALMLAGLAGLGWVLGRTRPGAHPA